MIPKSNKIPQSLSGLLNAALDALAGARAAEAEVGLAQNTAARIAADVYRLTGNPQTPEVSGVQTLYAAQLSATKDAYMAKAKAVAGGREFCRLAINLLRPKLGNEWTPAWNAAGLRSGSLALPRKPRLLLVELRGYFAANPEHENAQAGITAAEATAVEATLTAAEGAVAVARRERVRLKQERDAAMRTLRRRLSGLRAELEQVLEDNSGLWYKFGFRRPIDGKSPEPVKSVEVQPLGPGVAQVAWEGTKNAESYRVSWRPESDENAWTETGLQADRAIALTNLPDTPILIAVTARNRTGETPPLLVVYDPATVADPVKSNVRKLFPDSGGAKWRDLARSLRGG